MTPSIHPPEEYSAGPFVIDVRRGKVKGPQQRAFTPAAWKQGFEKYPNPPPSDVRLYVTGLWFAVHFAEMRKLTEACAATAKLRRPLSIMAILAAANREAVLLKKQLTAIMGERDSFTMEGLGQVKLKTLSGNPLYFSSAIDNLNDVKTMLDGPFLEKIQANFQAMHQAKLAAFERAFPPAEADFFDEII